MSELRYQVTKLDSFRITKRGLEYADGTKMLFECPYCEFTYRSVFYDIFMSTVKSHLRDQHRIYATFQTGSFELKTYE